MCAYGDEGVTGGEGGDVGAGDDGAAEAVDGGTDVVDELERRGAERLVGDLEELAAGPVEEHGGVAALREAVMEEDADERRRDAHVAPEGLADVVLHDVVQVRARRVVEPPRQPGGHRSGAGAEGGGERQEEDDDGRSRRRHGYIRE